MVHWCNSKEGWYGDESGVILILGVGAITYHCTVILTGEFLGRLCQTFPKYSMALPYVGLVYNTS